MDVFMRMRRGFAREAGDVREVWGGREGTVHEEQDDEEDGHHAVEQKFVVAKQDPWWG